MHRIQAGTLKIAQQQYTCVCWQAQTSIHLHFSHEKEKQNREECDYISELLKHTRQQQKKKKKKCYHMLKWKKKWEMHGTWDKAIMDMEKDDK